MPFLLVAVLEFLGTWNIQTNISKLHWQMAVMLHSLKLALSVKNVYYVKILNQACSEQNKLLNKS